MKTLKWLLVLAIVLGLAGSVAFGADAVRVWEEPLVIPTYLTGEPEILPMFYQGRAYQGAQGHIYPYHLLDELTDVKQDKTYRAVYLENEYVKVCVLPELGGRIFSVVDKTDNYDIFYHQHVIKPALIGMLGAWISGGVEWCAIHHHRTTSFMPVDYTLIENPDGSRTIWVGETELRQRMKWMVGVSLHPGKSYVQSTVRIFNGTPFAQSFLYWANAAISANKDAQVIFPPSVDMATYHSKNQFSHWPISHEKYSGADYTAGVDVSWIKNHMHWNSFFAWNCQEDFLGAYDHGREAGVVAIADHNILPGKKLWTWGNDEHARMWEKILTDSDGPYAEPMIGGYSDNQPDYSWLQPYEARVFSHYWYPLRQIGGVKNANLDVAVNLDITGSRAKIGVNASSSQKSTRVVLENAGKAIWQEQADIGPAQPFVKEIDLPAGTTAEGLKLTVSAPDGKELISYQPAPPKKESPLPEVVKRPAAPQDIKTVEELYLAGQRLEQFHSAAAEPYPYYEEALKRDGGNYAVNTALGILYAKRGVYTKAKEHLSVALQRSTNDYVHPRDGEAFYYLGVALRGLGDNDAAYAAFYKATWSAAWTSAACYSLAELSCLKGQYSQALGFVDRALGLNSLNGKAIALKSALLRHMDRPEEARRLVEAQLRQDPLDFWSGNEMVILSGAKAADSAEQPLAALETKMRNATASYIELAADYGNAGLWAEAIAVLDRAISSGGKTVDPLLTYYRGSFNFKPVAPAKVTAQASPGYCFPFQLEAIDILQDATNRNPLDAQAPYYLGNLLYDIQPEKAVAAWEESAKRDDTFFIVHRNLGLAYSRANDMARAIPELEKAIACNPQEPRLFYELDVMYEAAGVAPEKRLALLQKHQNVVKQRDDALQQEITLLTLLGPTDQALELLSSRHFRVWEGGREISTVVIDARLAKGLELLRAGKAQEALNHFQQVLQPPANVDVYEIGDRAAQVQYCIGAAYQAVGDKDKARAAFELAAGGKHDSPEARAYQGMALKALGKEPQAAEVFAALIKSAEDRLKANEGEDFFAKFGRGKSGPVRQSEAHYQLGLGYLGQGEKDKAKAEFQQALELNQNHLWAKFQLSTDRGGNASSGPSRPGAAGS